MSKASEAALADLHAQLALTLKNAIENPGTDDSGDKLPVNSAILSVARQFLKDNFITSDAGAKSGPLSGLAGLPVFEDDNVVSIRK